MNTLNSLLVLTLLVSSTIAQADSTPVVNPYGKFLVGDGVEIEMAQFAQKNSDGLNDILMKMTGANAFNAGIDGKTIKYKAVHGGTGIDYQYEGKNWMIVRQPYGDWWTLIEVYLDGKTISLREDKAQSKEVRPLHLLTASQPEKK